MSAVDVAASADCLRAAGLGDAAVAAWVAARQEQTTDLAMDRVRYSQFWGRCDDLLRRLPPKQKRNEAETTAAEALLACAREHRERFLAAHAERAL